MIAQALGSTWCCQTMHQGLDTARSALRWVPAAAGKASPKTLQGPSWIWDRRGKLLHMSGWVCVVASRAQTMSNTVVSLSVGTQSPPETAV